MIFQQLLDESVQKHGHLCAGQVIGVRMAMLGCRLVGIVDPKDEKFRKQLIVFVEIDRCAADAIASVTGCQLGKRTLKFMDFGINAATFVNLATRQSYRIVSTESSRELARHYASPGATSLQQQQLTGYRYMPDNLLFTVQRVSLSLGDGDMPGPPRLHRVCVACGITVRDGREITVGDQVLCRACSDHSYFQVVETVTLPMPGEMNMEEKIS
jgi:formylmethanofuran dehydrogenase subunit E